MQMDRAVRTRMRAERNIRDLEKFIAANWDKPEARWPRKPFQPAPRLPRQSAGLDGISVYIHGTFRLDWLVSIQTSLSDLRAAIEEGDEKVRIPWTPEGRVIGGFPAHAVRAASSKGARVVIGANVPYELPPEMEQFLADYQVDTRFLRRVDTRIPQTLVLQFADGRHRLIVDKGNHGANDQVALPVNLPDFRVLLLNPGEPEGRRWILKTLRDKLGLSTERPTVGLIARGDWDYNDWQLVIGSKTRVYLNQPELARTATHTAGVGADEGTVAHLKALRQLVGEAVTITATMGSRGSILVNHWPALIYASAAEVQTNGTPGAGGVTTRGCGDRFATSATLSAAIGASDGRNCLRGNMDAALGLLGQSPASMEELDAQIALRPEMTERQIPL